MCTFWRHLNFCFISVFYILWKNNHPIDAWKYEISVLCTSWSICHVISNVCTYGISVNYLLGFLENLLYLQLLWLCFNTVFTSIKNWTLWNIDRLTDCQTDWLIDWLIERYLHSSEKYSKIQASTVHLQHSSISFTYYNIINTLFATTLCIPIF